MATELANMFLSIIGLIAGGFIGVGFGMVQDAARQRNERLQESGKLKSGWAVMPGSASAWFICWLRLFLSRWFARCCSTMAFSGGFRSVLPGDTLHALSAACAAEGAQDLTQVSRHAGLMNPER